MYVRKYEGRLSGKNLEYCRNIQSVVSGLLKVARGGGKKLRAVDEFLFDAGVDHVNLSKVTRYIERQELCRKLMGFYKKVVEAEEKAPPAPQAGGKAQFVSKHVSPLSPVLDFLKRISGKSAEGKVRRSGVRSEATIFRRYGALLSPT